jgi:hypothetical protein
MRYESLNGAAVHSIHQYLCYDLLHYIQAPLDYALDYAEYMAQLNEATAVLGRHAAEKVHEGSCT